MFSKLIDELREIIGAPRKKPVFRYSLKRIALYLGILHRTVESNTYGPLLPADQEKHLIQNRLFSNKIAFLEQARRLGFGLDRESFETARRATPITPPAVSLKVSCLSISLPPDACSILSSENIGTEAKSVSLANKSANREKTHEGSSQDNVGYIAGEASSGNSSTWLSCDDTLWGDVLMSPPRHCKRVVSPDPFCELPVLSHEETRTRYSKQLSLRQRVTISASSQDDLTFKSRQQSSQVLDGQKSVLYHLNTNGYSRDPARLNSYSRTQRNRQSSGVSVKTQAPDGQRSVLQVNGNVKGVYDLDANGYSRNPGRLASSSRTQRNRQSSVVSVNTLTTGFERLSVSKIERPDERIFNYSCN